MPGEAIATSGPGDVARALDDIARLDAVRAIDLPGSDGNAVLDRLTRLARRLLDVPVALVSLVGADRQDFASCEGLVGPDGPVTWTPLSHSFCQHVVIADHALVVPDAREHPVLRDNRAVAELDVVAYLGVPLRDRHGNVLGSFCVIDHRPRKWSPDDVTTVEDLAVAATSELILLQTLADERDARRETQAAVTRLRQLITAGAAMAESLDYDRTLDNIMRLLVPEHADICVLDLLDGDEIRRTALGSPEAGGTALRLLEEYAPRRDAREGVGLVLRSGVPRIVADMGPGFFDRIGMEPAHRELVADIGLRAVIILPLRIGDRIIGGLSLVSREMGRYRPDDLAFYEELASRMGLAIENARLYRDRDETARSLQTNLLPTSLAVPPGCEAAAQFHLARGGSEVGGDFYDLFRVDDRRWMAVVGDVQGKGVAAAELTGLARHTVRGAGLRSPEPRRVLQTLNDALLMDIVDPTREDPRFCTVVCVLAEPAEAGLNLTVVCGGHAPALVLRADGRVEAIGGEGTLLGVVAQLELPVRHALLSPGDTMLLYTDGLTDARAGDGEFFGDERLRAALEAATPGAGTVAEEVTAAALAWQEGGARDDTTVLTLSVDRPHQGTV